MSAVSLAFYFDMAATVARAFRIVAKERVVAVAAIAILALVGGSLSGVVFLVIADVILFVSLAFEHQRIEGTDA